MFKNYVGISHHLNSGVSTKCTGVLLATARVIYDVGLDGTQIHVRALIDLDLKSHLLHKHCVIYFL